jgi:hypothetical protein
MPEYDFQSLSSFDFPIVSRDLLQKKLGVVFATRSRLGKIPGAGSTDA